MDTHSRTYRFHDRPPSPPRSPPPAHRRYQFAPSYDRQPALVSSSRRSRQRQRSRGSRHPKPAYHPDIDVAAPAAPSPPHSGRPGGQGFAGRERWRGHPFPSPASAQAHAPPTSPVSPTSPSQPSAHHLQQSSQLQPQPMSQPQAAPFAAPTLPPTSSPTFSAALPCSNSRPSSHSQAASPPVSPSQPTSSSVVQSPDVVQHEMDCERGPAAVKARLHTFLSSIATDNDTQSNSITVNNNAATTNNAAKDKLFITITDESPPNASSLRPDHAVVIAVHPGTPAWRPARARSRFATPTTTLVSRHGTHTMSSGLTVAVEGLLTALLFFCTEEMSDDNSAVFETAIFWPAARKAVSSAVVGAAGGSTSAFSATTDPGFRVVVPMPQLHIARWAVFSTLESGMADNIVSPPGAPVSDRLATVVPAPSAGDKEDLINCFGLVTAFAEMDTTDIGQVVPLLSGNVMDTTDTEVSAVHTADNNIATINNNTRNKNNSPAREQSAPGRVDTLSRSNHAASLPSTSRGLYDCDQAAAEIGEGVREAARILLAVTNLLGPDFDPINTPLATAQADLSALRATRKPTDADMRCEASLRTFVVGDRLGAAALRAFKASPSPSQSGSGQASASRPVSTPTTVSAATMEAYKAQQKEVIRTQADISELIAREADALSALSSPAWRLRALTPLADVEETAPLTTLKDMRRALWELVRSDFGPCVSISLASVEKAMHSVRALAAARRDDQLAARRGDRNRDRDRDRELRGRDSERGRRRESGREHGCEREHEGERLRNAQVPVGRPVHADATAAAAAAAEAAAAAHTVSDVRGEAGLMTTRAGAGRGAEGVSSTGSKPVSAGAGGVGGVCNPGAAGSGSRSGSNGGRVRSKEDSDKGGPLKALTPFVQVRRRGTRPPPLGKGSGSLASSALQSPGSGGRGTLGLGHAGVAAGVTQAGSAVVESRRSGAGGQVDGNGNGNEIAKAKEMGSVKLPKKTKRVRFIEGEVVGSYRTARELSSKAEVRALFRDDPSGVGSGCGSGAGRAKMSRVGEALVRERVRLLTVGSIVSVMAMVSELVRRMQSGEPRCDEKDDDGAFIDVRYPRWGL